MRYLDLYDVPEIKTFLRATLRHPSFCKGWQAVINLGLTDEQDKVDTKGFSYAKWLKGKTAYGNGVTLQEHIVQKLNLDQSDKLVQMLDALGLFSEQEIKDLKASSSADVLLAALLSKWEMQPADKDMVVMQHEVEYLHKGKKIELTSTMVLKGENREHSAMAKTVGLPMGMLARMVLNNKVVPPKGVVIPNMPAVYKPILTELQHHGISFTETVE
jgi:saccharopine dehydrogenase-like NADP-dependent oxidoreductase